MIDARVNEQTRRGAVQPGVAILVVALLSALTHGCGVFEHQREGARPEVTTEELHGSTLYKVLEKDAIPSIDEPRFVPADEADFMKDEEPVLGVTDGRVAKAYSLWLLDSHEIVNDTLGERPIAATW